MDGRHGTEGRVPVPMVKSPPEMVARREDATSDTPDTTAAAPAALPRTRHFLCAAAPFGALLAPPPRGLKAGAVSRTPRDALMVGIVVIFDLVSIASLDRGNADVMRHPAKRPSDVGALSLWRGV